MLTANPIREVVPKINGYRHYLFAFTPECTRIQDGRPCQDDQFGATNLSGKPEFLSDYDISKSNLSKQIVKCVGTVVQDYDADKYMQINYEAADIQAAVMKARMPLARHRLGCACCADKASALVRLSMIADTIADIRAGHHRAKPTSPQARWTNFIDRAWLEGILYFEDDEPASVHYPSNSSKTTTKGVHDYEGVRQLMTFEGKAQEHTVVVILADIASAAWILNASPFPKVERQPRTGEMFHLQFGGFGQPWPRSFLGTFETKGALKRRRVTSPPPGAAESTRKASAQHKRRLSKIADGEDELH